MSWSEENPYCPRCGSLTIAPNGAYACCGYKPIKVTLPSGRIVYEAMMQRSDEINKAADVQAERKVPE